MYREAKIYYDGSHYIAIPHTEKRYRPRRKKREEIIELVPPQSEPESIGGLQSDRTSPDGGAGAEKATLKTTKKELFERLYAENDEQTARERQDLIAKELRPYFEGEEETKAFVREHLSRKKRNMICRRIRLSRKVYLQEFNYFATFTYDGKLHTEESFRKGLKSTLKNFVKRKAWKYIGVWERSPEKQRLHFHCLLYVPDGALPSELDEREDYSISARRMQVIHECTYFSYRFGRNDFERVENTDKKANAVTYMLKYIEKTGGKIVCSKGLTQYFISDILETDVIARIGIEEKKLLLYDDFMCFDEGCYMGRVGKDTIAKMRKSD